MALPGPEVCPDSQVPPMLLGGEERDANMLRTVPESNFSGS